MEQEQKKEFFLPGVLPGDTLRALAEIQPLQFAGTALTVTMPDDDCAFLGLQFATWVLQRRAPPVVTRTTIAFVALCASATHLPLREAVLRDDAGNLLNACGQIARQFRPSTVQTSERITLGAGVVLCIE